MRQMEWSCVDANGDDDGGDVAVAAVDLPMSQISLADLS